MFVSSLVWLSRSLRSPTSNVEQLLLQAVIATLLAVASPMAPPKDLCLEDLANFARQMHTIGSIDGQLWAITKDNWTVYELVPCQHHSCMVVSSPVTIDTKWPKLAEYVKSAAGTKDFNFTVDNSALMNSTSFEHSVLAMYFNQTVFSFVFGVNLSIETNIASYEIHREMGLWISSDAKGHAYRLFDYGKQVSQFLIKIDKTHDNKTMIIKEVLHFKMSICNVTQQDGGNLEVQFKNTTCAQYMNWNVLKGLYYREKFYFFLSDKVFTFSDKAQTSRAEVETVSYGDFFHCHKPTTMIPTTPSTPNVTNTINISITTHDPPLSTTKGTIKGTTKDSKIKALMIAIIIAGVILALIMIVCGFWFYVENQDYGIGNQMTTSNKNGGKGSRGRILTGKGKQQSQQLKARQSKANATGKAKSSMKGSKVSMSKVPSVAQPKSKAFKAQSTV